MKVKVKRCVAGRFRTVWARVVADEKGGSFHAAFRLATRGFFFADAYYYSVHPPATSDKQYLRLP